MPKRERSSTAGLELHGASRRRFFGVSTAALGAALLPHGRVWASDAPEVAEMKFGIIALTDNSPIVIAHEKGFLKKYGISSVVSKGASWAAIRDSLSTGDIQATHMLLGMPIASTMGLLGSPKKPMVIPWILNRNGQSITHRRSGRRGPGEHRQARLATPKLELRPQLHPQGDRTVLARRGPPGRDPVPANRGQEEHPRQSGSDADFLSNPSH